MLKVKSNGNTSVKRNLPKVFDKIPVIPFEQLCERYGYIPDPDKLDSETRWHFNQFVYRTHLLESPDLQRIQEEVLMKQGYKCDDCGTPQTSQENPRFRTKIPVCEGGVGVENLKLICKACKGRTKADKAATKPTNVEYTSKGIKVTPLKNGCTYEGMKKMIANNSNLSPDVKAAKLKEIEETGTLGTNSSKPQVSQKRIAFNTMKKFPMFKDMVKPRLYFEQSGHCAICEKHISKEKVTIDHIIPLDKGGLNEESNMQILCHTCNVQKNNMEVKDKVFNPDGTVTITLG